jgi:hypothetical protein
MRAYNKYRRRTHLAVESLEEKTLLSLGPMMHRIAPHGTAAPIVAEASAVFSGTLNGTYSNIHAPGFANILSYATSGTLSGVGPTRLRGSLLIRSHPRPGRLIGQFTMRNSGGSMIVNVRLATPGAYSYKVVRARGSDSAFLAATGTLVITQSPTFHAPFYTFGQATMTFSPS